MLRDWQTATKIIEDRMLRRPGLEQYTVGQRLQEDGNMTSGGSWLNLLVGLQVIF